MKKFIAFAAVALLAASCAPKTAEEAAHAFHPDWSKNAVIYEVNVRQFTPEGSLDAFEKELPRIKELGADILWFMPMSPIGVAKRKGILGSYYSISDYSAINPEFGDSADFARVVDEAHKLGMKVILDWVPNHTAWDHHWMTEHPEFYYRDSATGEISNGRNDHNQPTDWTDVAELDYDNKELWTAMQGELMWWLKNMKIDGFRYDMMGGQPLEFWQQTNAMLRAENPELFLLGETEFYWAHESQCDMTYGWEFHHLLNKACQGEDVATIDAYLERQEKDFPQDGYRMYFIDNHDENSWNGTVEKRIGANAQAAYIICATMEQGMPLIYSGQEVGLNKSLRFFERDTIDWSLPSQADFYAKVSALKHDNPALNSGDFGGAQSRITTGDPRVYAFARTKGDNSVLVFVNFDGKSKEVTYGNAPAGTYVNHFTGESVVLSKSGTLSLPANGYLVLTAK